MVSKETRDKIVAALMGVDAFHLALGRFVAKFSEVEALIQSAFWLIAGVAEPVAQAAFSGVRTDEAMNKINRIADAQGWRGSRRELKDAVFGQLRHINKLRNNILHYGANLEDVDTWRVTNRDFVHVPENISSEIISPATLKAATDDLDDIEDLLLDLIVHHDETTKARLPLIAWQYTPPSQADRQRTSRDKAPKPEVPR